MPIEGQDQKSKIMSDLTQQDVERGRRYQQFKQTDHLRSTTIKVHDHGFVRLIDWMGTDRDIVAAARVSYGAKSGQEEILKRLKCKTLGEAMAKFQISFSENDDVWSRLEEVADKKLLKYLFEHKHVSPFEMCKIKFNIKMPIFVQRQFIRHRMQNFNEVSARYTELPDDFFIPEKWRTNLGVANKQSSIPMSEPVLDHRPTDQDSITATEWVRRHYQDSYELYKLMLEAGIAREQARIVLPVGIYTEFISCWDLNNLLKFFALRDDPHAQQEHQDYARAMKALTAKVFPWTMELYESSRSDNKA